MGKKNLKIALSQDSRRENAKFESRHFGLETRDDQDEPEKEYIEDDEKISEISCAFIEHYCSTLSLPMCEELYKNDVEFFIQNMIQRSESLSTGRHNSI